MKKQLLCCFFISCMISMQILPVVPWPLIDYEQSVGLANNRDVINDPECNKRLVTQVFKLFSKIPTGFDPREDPNVKPDENSKNVNEKPSVICWTHIVTSLKDINGKTVDVTSEYAISFQTPKDSNYNYVLNKDPDIYGNTRTYFITTPEIMYRADDHVIKKQKHSTCDFSSRYRQSNSKLPDGSFKLKIIKPKNNKIDLYSSTNAVNPVSEKILETERQISVSGNELNDIDRIIVKPINSLETVTPIMTIDVTENAPDIFSRITTERSNSLIPLKNYSDTDLQSRKHFQILNEQLPFTFREPANHHLRKYSGPNNYKKQSTRENKWIPSIFPTADHPHVKQYPRLYNNIEEDIWESNSMPSTFQTTVYPYLKQHPRVHNYIKEKIWNREPISSTKEFPINTKEYDVYPSSGKFISTIPNQNILLSTDQYPAIGTYPRVDDISFNQDPKIDAYLDLKKDFYYTSPINPKLPKMQEYLENPDPKYTFPVLRIKFLRNSDTFISFCQNIYNHVVVIDCPYNVLVLPDIEDVHLPNTINFDVSKNIQNLAVNEFIVKGKKLCYIFKIEKEIDCPTDTQNLPSIIEIKDEEESPNFVKVREPDSFPIRMVSSSSSENDPLFCIDVDKHMVAQDCTKDLTNIPYVDESLFPSYVYIRYDTEKNIFGKNEILLRGNTQCYILKIIKKINCPVESKKLISVSLLNKVNDNNQKDASEENKIIVQSRSILTSEESSDEIIDKSQLTSTSEESLDKSCDSKCEELETNNNKIFNNVLPTKYINIINFGNISVTCYNINKHVFKVRCPLVSKNIPQLDIRFLPNKPHTLLTQLSPNMLQEHEIIVKGKGQCYLLQKVNSIKCPPKGTKMMTIINCKIDSNSQEILEKNVENSIKLYEKEATTSSPNPLSKEKNVVFKTTMTTQDNVSSMEYINKLYPTSKLFSPNEDKIYVISTTTQFATGDTKEKDVYIETKDENSLKEETTTIMSKEKETATNTSEEKETTTIGAEREEVAMTINKEKEYIKILSEEKECTTIKFEENESSTIKSEKNIATTFKFEEYKITTSKDSTTMIPEKNEATTFNPEGNKATSIKPKGEEINSTLSTSPPVNFLSTLTEMTEMGTITESAFITNSESITSTGFKEETDSIPTEKVIQRTTIIPEFVGQQKYLKSDTTVETPDVFMVRLIDVNLNHENQKMSETIKCANIDKHITKTQCPKDNKLLPVITEKLFPSYVEILEQIPSPPIEHNILVKSTEHCYILKPVRDAICIDNKKIPTVFMVTLHSSKTKTSPLLSIQESKGYLQEYITDFLNVPQSEDDNRNFVLHTSSSAAIPVPQKYYGNLEDELTVIPLDNPKGNVPIRASLSQIKEKEIYPVLNQDINPEAVNIESLKAIKEPIVNQLNSHRATLPTTNSDISQTKNISVFPSLPKPVHLSTVLVKNKNDYNKEDCYEVNNHIQVKNVPCPVDTSTVPAIINPDFIKLLCPTKLKPKLKFMTGLEILRKLNMIIGEPSGNKNSTLHKNNKYKTN